MFFSDGSQKTPGGKDGGPNSYGVNYYALCRDCGVAARSGNEIPFGRLGLDPRRFADDLASASQRQRSEQESNEDTSLLLRRAFRVASGGGRSPGIDLLFDARLAKRFRERCGSLAEDPVAQYLRREHYGAFPEQEGGRGIFPTRLSTLPAGCEAAIEWPLVRLWCESTHRPDNIVDLLCERDNAERFAAMSCAFLRTAVSGLSDSERKVLVAKWAIDIESRRFSVTQWLSDDERRQWHARKQAAAVGEWWRSLGDHPVPKRSAGIVELRWGAEPAWVSVSANLRLTIDTLVSGDLLRAAAAHGWWDVTPEDLAIRFLAESQIPSDFSATNETDTRGMGPGIRQPRWPNAEAMEVTMLRDNRPFLNLPIRMTAQRR
jgi:hypothetical protein